MRDADLDDDSVAAARLDPADTLAAIGLSAALRAAGLPAAAVTAPGTIVSVEVCAASWALPVRAAWMREVVGATGDWDRREDYAVPWQEGGSAAIAVEHAPEDYESEHSATRFARLVARVKAVVGIAADLAWLPPDLVAAADHRIVVGVPTPEAISELVLRLMGDRGTITLTEAEAAAVTPRHLRLSVRPGQSADRFLAKLRTLVAAEAGSSPRAKPGPTGLEPSVREVPPFLDRLSGMDDAVAWGLKLRDDVAAYRAGLLPWADVDRGLLISGPPGTGKTSFARSLAATCGIPLALGSYAIWISAGEGYQGDLIRSLRATFTDARSRAPCILFLDEVDAFPDRTRAGRSNRQWDIQVLSALLAEIDGIEARVGVVLVAACNHPSLLDPALVRAGRLDRHIRLELPDRSALIGILRMHLGEALAGEELGRIAMLGAGMTGADVERAVRGARRRARQASRAMVLADLEAEVASPDDAMPAEVAMVAAVHEAGHAVAAVALGLELELVSLRQTGRMLASSHLRMRPQVITTADVNAQLIMLMAGRAAEVMAFGRPSTGCGGGVGSDLHCATVLAARAAAEFGLDDRYGLLWTSIPERGGDLVVALNADPRLARLVKTRLKTAHRDALELVKGHRGAVDELAGRLLAAGALDDDEVIRIVAAKLEERRR